MRLVDFHISVGPAGLTADQRKAINERLFPIYEAIRLWLRERKVTAPFRKILVSLSDRRVSERWHATATVALGICEVLEAIDIDLLAPPLTTAGHVGMCWMRFSALRLRSGGAIRS
ncbi:MAG: hypothetical protein J0I07_37895 [Myxococcales bacterium]|nr:hypothetical protein [Myxococcales bacterium]